MGTVAAFHVGLVPDQHCSLSARPLPPAQTIEQKVGLIFTILSKNLLCKHDVQQINKTYQEIEILERQFDPVPVPNSKDVLEKVVEKIRHIIGVQRKMSQSWISFYHLQEFIDPGLKLKASFVSAWNRLEKNRELISDLVETIPCCELGEQFNRDIETLIGPNVPLGFTSILQRRTKEIEKRDQLHRIVLEKKEQLQQERDLNPQEQLRYLDELLDGGFIHLYDHLVKMRKLADRDRRGKAVEELSLSSVSHIILETREAIVRKVENSIPDRAEQILFLVGGTGSGKSTTLCFLRGDRMILKDLHYESLDDQEQIIGLDPTTSCTFLPTVAIVNGFLVIDFPGFNDTHSPLISIGIEFALTALLKKYQKARILVLESIINKEEKFIAADALGTRIRRLVSNKHECLLGLTKYSDNPHYIKLKEIEEKEKIALNSPSAEEERLQGQIEAFLSLNMPQLQSKIELLQQQLEIKQKERLENPVSHIGEKRSLRENLQKRENDLSDHVGVGKIIRFDKLDDPNLRSSCWATLMERSPIRDCSEIPHKPTLDPIHEKLLDRLFETKLKKAIQVVYH